MKNIREFKKKDLTNFFKKIELPTLFHLKCSEYGYAGNFAEKNLVANHSLLSILCFILFIYLAPY